MNYTDDIRSVLSQMKNRSMHEDIYRIMDALKGKPEMANLANLVGKIDKMCRKNYGLTQQVANLKEKDEKLSNSIYGRR